MSVTALIVAAGKGERLGGGVPKQYRPIGGKPVLRRAVEALMRHPAISRIQLVIGAGQEDLASQALAGLPLPDPLIGGETRQESVLNGLKQVETERVLVHDAARPFCPTAVVDRLLGSLDEHDGSVPVLPAADTLARADGLLGEPIDRTGAVRVQTPQAFHTDRLRSAHAAWTGGPATDDGVVARAAGARIAAVEGDPLLEKLTTQSDWLRAEALLAAQMIPRTGMGFDVHGFSGDGPVLIGGVEIPHARGLSGHSDADVALHAITDALLGAAALGDIGQHFPPSDPRWKGASSDIFMAHAADLIRARGGIIDHVDCTIIAEEPRVGPHRPAMQARIADILGVRPERVSVKATTTEGLGFTGRREGVAAQAVANIRMESNW